MRCFAAVVVPMRIYRTDLRKTYNNEQIYSVIPSFTWKPTNHISGIYQVTNNHDYKEIPAQLCAPFTYNNKLINHNYSYPQINSNANNACENPSGSSATISPSEHPTNAIIGSNGYFNRQLSSCISPSAILANHGNGSDGAKVSKKLNIPKKTKPTIRKSKTKRTKRTPRPPNAFILYRKNKQQDVVALNKTLTNAEVSKVISKLWWKETEEERFKWEKVADRIKLQHMQLHPDYVYQPRTKKKKSTKNVKNVVSSNNNLPANTSVARNSKQMATSALKDDDVLSAIAETAFAGSKASSMTASSNNDNSNNNLPLNIPIELNSSYQLSYPPPNTPTTPLYETMNSSNTQNNIIFSNYNFQQYANVVDPILDSPNFLQQSRSNANSYTGYISPTALDNFLDESQSNSAASDINDGGNCIIASQNEGGGTNNAWLVDVESYLGEPETSSEYLETELSRCSSVS
ncbi:4480_t:CDS:2 [Ambispora leptoticha]|uniref:4480_t:CDS:1 n=1 Tax=Ambispora leptoticha TaxID=144679 RepID=A0A9N9BKZ3_9GLOM|nr:4480_t:CDS:2 [Ambispora leptoticha]